MLERVEALHFEEVAVYYVIPAAQSKFDARCSLRLVVRRRAQLQKLLCKQLTMEINEGIVEGCR